MRRLINLFVSLLIGGALIIPMRGQGTIEFNTFVPWIIDARVFEIDHVTPLADPAWKAQLFGFPAGASIETMQPLFPITTFQGAPFFGYVEPVIVTFPGLEPGEPVVLQMWAFLGESWEEASIHGGSDLVQITLGGGDLPPAQLFGLHPWVIPEPGTWALGLTSLFAFALQWLRRRQPRPGAAST
jgi:hypothetical protein